MPAPIDPPDTVPTSSTNGNTSTMPASASLPSFASHQVSTNAAPACASMISMFGHDEFQDQRDDRRLQKPQRQRIDRSGRRYRRNHNLYLGR